MPKRKKPSPKPEKPLDTVPGKRPRGRPGAPASEIAGRSQHYRLLLNQTWGLVGEKLLHAKTEEEVGAVFEFAHSYHEEFKGIASLILKVVGDPHFPKTRDARINFLADSLAAREEVSPRRSRDICGRERASQKRLHKHHIIRHEYYIECSCGYKGPARDNACKRCGAAIPPSIGGGPLAWLGP